MEVIFWIIWNNVSQPFIYHLPPKKSFQAYDFRTVHQWNFDTTDIQYISLHTVCTSVLYTWRVRLFKTPRNNFHFTGGNVISLRMHNLEKKSGNWVITFGGEGSDVHACRSSWARDRIHTPPQQPTLLFSSGPQESWNAWHNPLVATRKHAAIAPNFFTKVRGESATGAALRRDSKD